jgi:hypothetical protein
MQRKDLVKLSVSSKGWLVLLGSVTIALNAIGLVLRAVTHLLGYGNDLEIVRLFHVAQEANIPTWFSSLLLLISASLLAIISKVKCASKDPYRRHWVFLAVVFLAMSLDETSKIHEISIVPLRAYFNATGFFYYAWVIVGIPFVLLFGLLYVRFLLHLPSNTRWGFILSGIIYISGAIGMEMLGGYFVEKPVGQVNIYPFIITLEELLENFGVVLFIFSLTHYMGETLHLERIKIEFT